MSEAKLRETKDVVSVAKCLTLRERQEQRINMVEELKLFIKSRSNFMNKSAAMTWKLVLML